MPETFMQDVKEKIIEVINVSKMEGSNYLKVTLLVEQFNRRTIRPYIFGEEEWEEIRIRNHL